MKSILKTNVFEESIKRMEKIYSEGHHIVVSFSGGKDSTAMLEVCMIAARNTGKLPIEVIMRDEEIMFPGTFEYCERIAKRKDIKFYWYIMNQPVVNMFNRACPYFWVFDPLLPKEKWVRQPPDYAIYLKDNSITRMVTPERFPADEGKKIISCIGLRAQESMNRKMGIMSSKGFMTKHPNSCGVYYARPIYDWTDSDVWKIIKDDNLDYNKAYDVMFRLGLPKNLLRIAPPTMAVAGIRNLKVAYQAFPEWFDKVCERLPGVRSAVYFGRRVVEPHRRLGETWEECFHRECIKDAPKWIADRATKLKGGVTKAHQTHSSTEIPQIKRCVRCGMIGSWKSMAYAMYFGDCFSQKQKFLPEVEPEFFRPGSGKWLGKPTF